MFPSVGSRHTTDKLTASCCENYVYAYAAVDVFITYRQQEGHTATKQICTYYPLWNELSDTAQL